ncbi:hypothetical protein BGX26_002337 [Mortierella sp. AD094]|nr:hypothetical protein BGX26_002337 [Mortierella sp. AD094]
MRLITLCTIFTATLAAVAAQEIIAVEEWLESMKLSRGLVARNLHNKGQRHHQNHNHHRHHQQQQQRHSSRSRKNNSATKRSLIQAGVNAIVLKSSSTPPTHSAPRLQKRFKGFTPRSEIEQRASDFKSFQADALVAAPVVLQVLHETPSAPSALNKKTKKIKKAVVGEQKLQLINKKLRKTASGKKNVKRNLHQHRQKLKHGKKVLKKQQYQLK